MVNSIAIYTSFLRAILGLAGVRPQSVEIEPGTVVHIWAPSETAKKTNNLKQAENKPSKPAVVFLHGFGFNGILSWQFQVLALAKEYSVYVPDFLFFGGSITDRTERSPAFQAECMAKCLRKLGVEKCTLVGLSYGGMVGFKMAEMFPDLVDSFVVSCSVMALTESISRASLERIGFPSWVRHLVPDTVEGVKKIVDVSNYKSLWMPHFLYKDVFETAYNINRKERVELLDALIVKDKDFSPTSYPQNTAVKRLKERNPSKDGLVCTARKPWIAVGMRNVDYKRARHFEVDLSAFRNILEIDRERMVARVEPLVNMGQISRASVPMNLSLAVVAELDDLTVGGLINGYGIEGSSHIYGLFSDTVVAYEIVLADGQVVRATKDNEYSDLFYAVPWSQGTLGLLVSAEIKLIPVKEYMRLTYKPVVGNLKELAQAYIDSFAPRDGDQDNPSKVPDFVETMIYNSTEGVMMTGRYASKEEAKKKGNVINNVGWWFKPWFYQHAQTALKKGEFVEYIPTREYYHRHTRCLYWEGKLILPFADQWWFRFLLGWLMPPKVSLLKATQGEAIRNYYHEMHVIQDMLVPLYKVGDALEWVDREMEVYPIWLCPHRLFKLPVKTMVYPEPGFEHQHRQGDTSYAQMYTDVGVYYSPGPVLRGEVFDGAEAVRRMEDWLIENHGFQPQYAVSELNEKKFWRMFDADLYEHARKKYGAVGTFMSVYYKSKKGRKTEKEVREAEQAHLETAYAEAG